MALNKIGIAGVGFMGATMAQIFAEQGFPVTAWGRSDSSIARGKSLIKSDRELPIHFTTDMKDLADMDIIIESVTEDLKIKQELFEKLSGVVSADTILATNTSGLSMNKISVNVKDRSRFIGMHWFNPSNLIPLNEIISCDETRQDVIDAVYELSKRIGKKPVICRKDVPGFIANRIQLAILRESMYMAENGIASVEDIDTVMKYSLGLRYAAYGPFEVADFAGLDTFYHISEYLNQDLCDYKKPMKLIEEHFKNGEYGTKSGKGFYDYTGKDVDAVVAERNRRYEAISRTQQDYKEI